MGLARHVRAGKLGEILVAPVDVVLDADADLVVQPDLLFVGAARASLVGDRIFGAPDMVVEVLSPYPRIGHLEEKIGWYARYGVKECWLASLAQKEIAVLALADGAVASRALFARGQAITSELLGNTGLLPVNVFGW